MLDLLNTIRCPYRFSGHAIAKVLSKTACPVEDFVAAFLRKLLYNCFVSSPEIIRLGYFQTQEEKSITCKMNAGPPSLVPKYVGWICCTGRTRLQLFAVLLIACFSLVCIKFTEIVRNFQIDSFRLPVSIDEYTTVIDTLDVCRFPEIDPFDPSLEKYLTRLPPLNCGSNVPNVVYIQNEEIKIDSAKVIKALKHINSSGKLGFCQYHVLQRKPNDDKSAVVISTSVPFNVSIKLKSLDEDIKVECFDTKNKTISRSYFTVLRLDPEKEQVHSDSYKVHIDKNSPAETLSILMIGIDALSKQHFARAMPKTRDFLMKELGALEMNKHSKLGYSTSPNVVPLLSGRTNEELTNDTKWRFKTRGWMDQINEAFVWSDARRLGYRTGLIFDEDQITAFHYLRKGFNKKPVDHYMRPLVVESIKDPLMRPHQKHCFGDEPEISKLYDYWLQLLHHYNSTKTNQTPFFAYSFLIRLSHDDYNMVFAGDELYLKFLKDLKATNALNNTVIIWFSDHGERYGEIRHTFTGEVETNTPCLFFVFPPWFEKKYPEVMRVFKTNQNRLTSHYDTYATLQDLLYFKGVVGPKGKRGERSISLFREIPLDRTCEDAQIPAEYCLCSGLSQADLAPGLAKYLGTVLRDKVMSILSKQKENCATLKLSSVERVLEEKTKGEETKSRSRNFRVSIVTVPGKAQFEARLSFDVSTNKAQVVGEVARTNMYRGQADCMDTANLRRYCYCKNLLETSAKT
ncbi:hypothetical protein RRG08_043567 [Elysia crispata]|uniref:Sulfatase N-terminal domain-containing protein n=1 Tax=Elysia crispata TaxID=231223 RepID=A0AAE1A5M9_9GAST|nr:hypothetical protein RRG08_043567 [Elysia crispata]